MLNNLGLQGDVQLVKQNNNRDYNTNSIESQTSKREVTFTDSDVGKQAYKIYKNQSVENLLG